jgi:hypothetical protein
MLFGDASSMVCFRLSTSSRSRRRSNRFTSVSVAIYADESPLILIVLETHRHLQSRPVPELDSLALQGPATE